MAWFQGLGSQYGLYQAVHIVENTRGLNILLSGVELDIPAPLPESGMSGEVHLMLSLARLIVSTL